MKCKKCKTDDWYERGKYRRCKECHRKTSLASYHALKIGSEQRRKNYTPARPVSEQLAGLYGKALEKRLQKVCSAGHQLTEDNVRLETDSKGRTHRRCLRCEHLKNYKRYGKELPSKVRDLMRAEDRPWESLKKELE